MGRLKEEEGEGQQRRAEGDATGLVLFQRKTAGLQPLADELQQRGKAPGAESVLWAQAVAMACLGKCGPGRCARQSSSPHPTLQQVLTMSISTLGLEVTSPFHSWEEHPTACV